MDTWPGLTGSGPRCVVHDMAKKDPRDTLGSLFPGANVAKVPDWIIVAKGPSASRVKAARRVNELVSKALSDTGAEYARLAALEVVGIIQEHDLMPENAKSLPKKKMVLALLKLAANAAASESEKQTAAMRVVEYIGQHKPALPAR